MPRSRSPRPRRDGVALVIILAFVVIITGVILAFFSRALSSRQVSNASASQAKVDQLAAGATDSIIGDLQQEIVMSSSATVVTTGSVTTTIYTPFSPVSMLPQISGTTANVTTTNGAITSVPGVAPNLLKRSAYNYGGSGPLAFYNGTNGSSSSAGTIPGGAINVSSTTPSLNGRTVSLARWNSHYLLPLLSNTDSTPVTPATPLGTGAPGTTGTDGFIPPDWVLITRSGTSPTTFSQSLVTSATNSTSVIGRYAYAIYHEGGLLDVNAVGYPMQSGSAAYNSPLPGLTSSQTGYKPNLAFADLTQLPGINGLTQAQQQAFTYNLVGWRNYSTAQPSSFPNYSFSSGSNYYNFAISNPTGFLTTGGTAMYNGQTDHMFGSRQELIAFLKKGLVLSGTSLNLNVLNYLATFTRGLNEPSIAPDPTRPTILSSGSGGNNVFPASGTSLEMVDSGGASNPINPNFLTLRASGAFLRNNGRYAVIGEPFVNKRFALQKLAWLTYLGPSANRNLTNPSKTGADADIWALENTYGISPSYLAQGGTANILKYFGLVWQVDPVPRAGISGFHDKTYKWYYTGHDYLSSTSVGGTAGSISRLGQIAALGANARDPDFFELLKAAVAAGSKAKGSINLSGTAATALITSSHGLDPYLVQTARDQSLDYAIIQLGANIIDQAKCDGYSTRIVFNDGSTAHEFRGVINQPYLYRVVTGDMKLRNEVTPATLSGTVSGPVTSGTITDTGVAMLMQLPTIWNPHDVNAPVGNPAPVNFRVVVDSTQPEQQDSSGMHLSYSQFAAYGSNSTNSAASTAASTSTNVCPAFSYLPIGSGTTISTLINSSITQPITSQTNYLTFSASNTALFREPTILARPNIPVGSNLAINTLGKDYGNVENSLGQTAFQTNGFVSDSSNPLNTPATVSATTTYIGIPLGLYPVAWAVVTSATNLYRSWFAALSVVNGGGTYLTYRLQYQDPNSADPLSSWITYDEKYVHIDTLFLYTAFNTSSVGNLLNTIGQPPIGSGGIWESFTDPRTSRFCSITGRNLGTDDNTPGATVSSEWADTGTDDVLYTERPDVNSGYGMSDDRNSNVTGPEFSAYRDLGWTLNPTPNSFLRQGLLSQNSQAVYDNGIRFSGDTVAVAPGVGNPEYYADPDGVVRNGMSAYVAGNSSYPAVTTTGLPMATAYSSSSSPNQTQSRPYILHRPFRSVAELGYVFSGTPWKNLDFMTPQSGDAPLLDLFTAYETPDPTNYSNPLVAGVVDLNTRQAPVLQALLTGAYVDETNLGLAGTHPISATEAAAIVNGTNGNIATLINRTGSTSGTSGPLENVGDFVGRWALTSGTGGTVTSGTYSGASADLTNLYAGAIVASGTSTVPTMQNIQRFREAVIRPLVAVGNTRVWNLMIDVIAQTGRYPESATSAASFMVDGEQRYWVHIAIDRFTGQVLDKQVEVVKD